jgi:hypothetical protein
LFAFALFVQMSGGIFFCCSTADYLALASHFIFFSSVHLGLQKHGSHSSGFNVLTMDVPALDYPAIGVCHWKCVHRDITPS